MTHLAPAAQQLIQQVQGISRRASARAVGDADGFNRMRSVEFDKRTSKWLVPALEACRDPRIEMVAYDGDRAVVHFVGDTRADQRTPFEIEAALRVLQEEN